MPFFKKIGIKGCTTNVVDQVITQKEQPRPPTRSFTNPFAARQSKADREASLEASGAPVSQFTKQDLYGCDAESIHLCGKIQGATGHLLLFDQPTGSIVAADDRILEVLWIQTPKETGTGDKVDSVIGVPLQACVPPNIHACLMDAVKTMKEGMLSRTFQFVAHEGVNYAVTLASTFRDYRRISAEIEIDSQTTSHAFNTTLLYLNRIMEFYANDSIVKAACDTMFGLLAGYDRGMVYKFHDDGSGEVIHEVKNEHVETSYAGLRFPALEIPPPIRNLYIKNVFRFIRDVEVDDVNVASDPEAGEIDLTHCRTRACNRCHIAYLRNMGVRASMSLAILVEGKLWGLFAFHAYRQPYKPSLHQRIAAETIASMVSARVESITRKKTSARIISLGETLMTWSEHKTFSGNLTALGPAILEVVDADVLVGIHQEERVVVGDNSLVPTNAFWTKVGAHQESKLLVVSDHQQIQERGLTLQECPASGFIFFHHGPTKIFLGRAARSKDVMWGGNPDEPRLYVDGKLNPRTSFAAFMQKAHKEARAWTPHDENVVWILRDAICSERSHDWMVALLKTDIEEANMRYFSAIDRAQDNSQFFAQLCHELRTPFHGVMGCLNILHDAVDKMSPEEIKELVSTAISSGNHMLNLLNDILVKSKNKYLSTKSVGSTVQYQTLAKEAVDGLQCLAANMKIDFTREIIPRGDKIMISTDRTKVIQIVSNIVNNAIKFAGQGLIDTRFKLVENLVEAIDVWEKDTKDHEGCAFSVSKGQMLTNAIDVREALQSRVTREERHWMCVSVADSGCGMKPQELVEMFKPYTMTGSRTDNRFKGTGLGLHITVTLCLQLEGFIACASTAGVGTVFHVGIPVEIRTDDDDCSESSDEVVEGDEGIPVCGPILVVDDNKINVRILKKTMSLELAQASLGIEVLTADGGEKAIAMYKERLPSIVIIDYHMPGIDGVGATKAIRKYETEQKLAPAYVMSYTADMSDESHSLIMACGSNAIMAKPPPKGFVASFVRRFRVVSTKNSVLDHLKWKPTGKDEKEKPEASEKVPKECPFTVVVEEKVVDRINVEMPFDETMGADPDGDILEEINVYDAIPKAISGSTVETGSETINESLEQDSESVQDSMKRAGSETTFGCDEGGDKQRGQKGIRIEEGENVHVRDDSALLKQPGCVELLEETTSMSESMAEMDE